MRVDTLNGLWGFCPTTVIAAADCGLAGSCVDSFSCSGGCGFTDQPLTTFTCSSGSDAAFCSTALLRFPDSPGAFTYLACGRGPITEEYLAFTTETSSSSKTQSSVSTATSTTEDRTATPGPTLASPSRTEDAVPTSTDTNNDTSQSQSSSAPINIGAIVGGVIGCVALICGCIIVLYWLRQRGRKAAAASGGSRPAEDATTPSANLFAVEVPGDKPRYDYQAFPFRPEDYNGVGVRPNGMAELSARSPVVHQPQLAEFPITIAPVELPSSAR
ncbi:hypothetical protein VTJ49DRAFT_3040 [Mycothermus thermophilus]